MNTKLIIFLGDSWTDGWWFEDPLIKNHPNPTAYGIPDNPKDREYQSYGFVSLFARQNPHIDVVNLGECGSANTGMYEKLLLHMSHNEFDQYEDVMVIQTLSSVERFSVLRYNEEYQDLYSHQYRVNMANNPNEMREFGLFEKNYFKSFIGYVYDDHGLNYFTNLSIINLQNLCKYNNWSFLICNAFDYRNAGLRQEKHFGKLVDWGNYFHDNVPYDSFARLLIDKDSQIDFSDFTKENFINHNIKHSSEYFSECFHPNLDGCVIIADEITKYLKKHKGDFFD